VNPQEVLALCREKDVKAVVFRLMDLPGLWQHFTIPVGRLSEDVFEEGIGFDGSRIRGWQATNESDMLAVPQADTAFIDPFTDMPTLNLICNIQDPITREDFSRDPRNIARKSVNYLQRTGFADTAHFGPESEFFVFDDVRFDQTANAGFYYLDSGDGEWNRGGDTRSAGEDYKSNFKLRRQEGYLAVPPADHLMNIRNEMMQTMIDCGLDVECQHHDVGTAGQSEIDLRFNDLVTTADHLMMYKYIVKNVARKHHKTATFMPKPIFGENGSGMHTHFSFWKEGNPLFAGSEYAGLSDMALHAIGGVLKHAPVIMAFSNPTTNSYKRLVPGEGTPVNLAYSQRDRSAACRIPTHSPSPKAKRVEFRCPDPSCNPYLAFAAIMMAAIDGIQNKISPGNPLESAGGSLEKDDREPQTEATPSIAQTPRSLDEALNALQADHDFLLRGEVFTPDVIDTWINYKRDYEADAMRARPHPFEFCLYYDV